MANPSDLKQFDFAFDPNLEFGEPKSMDEVGADPGVFLPNVEGRTEFLPPDAERIPTIPNAVDRLAPEYSERPAEERTRELLAHMAPHKQVLLGVLARAQDPCSEEAMGQAIGELRQNKFSVYSPSNICTMLEAAGALERTTQDGTPYAQFKPTPRIEVVNGEEYWVPADAPAVYWRTTLAGAGAIEANDPYDRAQRQLAREQEFASLYKRVLTLAAREQGATMAQLSGAVDSDPLICEPRRFFVQHFVEALERCECMAWQGGAWRATEVGLALLGAELASVEDNAPEATPVPTSVPTETQGVNW